MIRFVRSLSAAGLSLSFLFILLSVSVCGLAEPIMLSRPMQSFNQAYREGPGAWGNSALGTGGCPDEIWLTGCLVTAFASVLDYYEVELRVPANASYTGRENTGMDPGILNDWLQQNNGFGNCSQDPLGSCCLDWSRLPGNLEVSFHSNRSNVGLNPVAAVVIDHALRQGQPVIAGVHWGATCNGGTTQSEDCHWVVLTGKAGDTYAIIDPYNPDASSPVGVRTTLEDGVKGTYIIDRFVVVTQSSPPSSIPSSAKPDPTPETGSSTGSGAIGGLFATIAVLGALAAIAMLVLSANP